MATPHDANPGRPVAPAPDSPEAEQAAAAPQGWLRRNGPMLALLALFLVSAHFYFGMTWESWRNIATMAVGLGLLIFIHELGHFAVAKWCDVHVETFSIGFGPPLPGCAFRWGETLYKIAIIPFGGYVKMVGEGAEDDESDTDPRSFKNKPVWQRMAIISAGVTMNLILAFLCFVFVFRTHGDQQLTGVVGMVESGGPAWKVGVHSGDVIRRIGSRNNPTFQMILKEVMNSSAGVPLDFVFGPPGAPESELTHTQILPRKEERDPYPVIGMANAWQPKLESARLRKEHSLPVRYASAASRANPPFEFDDEIVATSDPDHPEQLQPLPPSPTNPGQPDFFAFSARMRRLAGQEALVQVRRAGQLVTITVPPAYHYTVGLRMRMGKVSAVRDQSPAAQLVQPGDIIEEVAVGQGSQKVRFTNAPGPDGDGTHKELDPCRLRFELEQWAAREPGAREVTLTLLRKNAPPIHKEQTQVTVTVPWDDSWTGDREFPYSQGSPLSIPALGIAFQVETTVGKVAADSPAAKAGIQDGDVIKAVRYEVPGKTPEEPSSPFEWAKLQEDQWADVFYNLQRAEVKKFTVRIDRDKKEVELTAVEDHSWPIGERGFMFVPDTRLEKADSLGQALAMGVDKTVFFISQIFGNLKGVATGRLSYRNFGGPIFIARAAFFKAGENIYEFLLFLGIIGVNLAVVNFLPIPVLDGGHMVFLIYEKIRGKPAPERVRVIMSLLGLVIILSIMVGLILLDFSRLKFW